MKTEEAQQQSIIPFLSPDIENKLIEQIGTLPESGIVTAWDPATMTACYVWVDVVEGRKPTMTRWAVEGPVSRDHAQNAGWHIASIVEKSTADHSVTIN
ncbi:MAG: hypothetical protein JAY74_22520 [Candidatus Thiodiazotropha taylori]|nr:hypothetical protein [Candidatus Thiodiazotropha taylori]